MPQIHLTAGEQKIFSKLPEMVRKGFEVREETLRFQDSDDKRAVRMRNLKLKSPILLAFQKKSANLKTVDDLKKAAETLDMSAIPQEDMIELYFAMGPGVVSVMIAAALEDAKTAESVGVIAGLAFIRHGLFLSMQPNALIL